MSGTLWGVGVGPGDPELLTLKAVRIMTAAPVIAHLAGREGPGMARTIAQPHLPGGQAELVLRMDFDPSRPPPDDAYDQGAEAIAGHLADGRDVAFLCEGDPLLFGSFIYVMDRLGARFPVRVVPGVSSLAACSAAALLPLATRETALAVVPATRPEAELERVLGAAEAAAVFKVGRHLPKLRRVLERLGRLERAMVVERAGWPDQQVWPLAEGAADVAPYFAMVLVGAER